MPTRSGKTAGSTAEDAARARDKIDDSQVFSGLINELNVNQDQLRRRQELLKRIETELSEKYNSENRVISYIMRFGHPRVMISSLDIGPIHTVLSSINRARELNVILHSPGGDGTVIEKMVEMCRDHLPMKGGKLRVIVPNIAKSAATVFALGADEIIMGYCSELGPIDPQVIVSNGGVASYVSAFAFVGARDALMEKIALAEKNKEPTTALLTQLASLNVPYVFEMDSQIQFAEKTATRLLAKYMLKPEYEAEKERNKAAGEIAKMLLSKQLFPSHSHFIGAKTARAMGLNIDVLDRSDSLWKLIWEYYNRAEIQMGIQIQPDQMKAKLFESATASIVGQEPVQAQR